MFPPVTDPSQCLREASLGQVGAQPAAEGTELQYSRVAQGRLINEEFGNIIVRTGADGAIVRLRDVARLELGAESYAASATPLGGAENVMKQINQAAGANAITTANGVEAELQRIRRRFRPD